MSMKVFIFYFFMKVHAGVHFGVEIGHSEFQDNIFINYQDKEMFFVLFF